MQARLAARSRMSLDSVLRKCVSAQGILSDYLVTAARDTRHSHGPTLQVLLREQVGMFECLARSVADEYGRGSHELHTCSDRVYAAQAQRLLDGELVDTSVFAYGFEQFHTGLVADGADAEASIRELAETLDRQPLVIARPGERVWAWLGGNGSVDRMAVSRAIKASWPQSIALGIGESAKGTRGWRLTHRQAQAAISVALGSGVPVSRYADSVLLASMFKDDVLAETLRERYIEPLRSSSDFDRARETLCAYIQAEQHTSSAAARLGVSRRTVTKRLRQIERAVGCSIANAAKEIEAAMQFDALTSHIGTGNR